MWPMGLLLSYLLQMCESVKFPTTEKTENGKLIIYIYKKYLMSGKISKKKPSFIIVCKFMSLKKNYGCVSKGASLFKGIFLIDNCECITVCLANFIDAKGAKRNTPPNVIHLQ